MNTNTRVSTVANDAVITVCRYIRPVAQFENAIAYSNLGGVTFVFTMDYGKRTVNAKFSICRKNENFNKKDGLRHAVETDGVTYNLDKFQAMANIAGGFTNAYISMLSSKFVAETLTPREKTLLEVLNDIGI